DKANTSFFTINGLNNDLNRNITGVVVVADNADDYMTKINIITIVKTALNVPAGKIEVVNMKEGKQ
ncbi:MAG: hypothetical protein IJR47_00180, partial [Clostridia bacterium]|nr:hypothetical protein [Clostridia bacterium]